MYTGRSPITENTAYTPSLQTGQSPTQARFSDTASTRTDRLLHFHGTCQASQGAWQCPHSFHYSLLQVSLISDSPGGVDWTCILQAQTFPKLAQKHWVLTTRTTFARAGLCVRSEETARARPCFPFWKHFVVASMQQRS
jgi:hypothetical protein